MNQINLIQAKGGQGTSVTACAVALRAAGERRTVRLDGHDHDSLAAIVGTTGDGPVIPGLVLGRSPAVRGHDRTSLPAGRPRVGTTEISKCRSREIRPACAP